MSWKYVQRNENGQYRTTDQGGGSGTVTDVKVDGQSVVDPQTGEANITMPTPPSVPDELSDLSDVQFNNLTDHQPLRYNATSQKWVNGADTYPPLIYSDNEREVGVWRDGKPLYQKTFASSYTTTSGTSWQVTDIDLSSCNIDTFIDAKALRESGNGLVIFDAITQFGLSTNNHLQILFEVSTPNYTLKYVTLLYTKTTDTAGSGTWTTQGTPTQHYSTTEQVVGTWINGKPLYEKTINYGNNVNVGYDNTVHTEILHGISNIGIVVNLFSICTGLNVFNDSLVTASDGTVICKFRVDSTRIYASGGSNHYGATADRYWYFIIRYTKTTD